MAPVSGQDRKAQFFTAIRGQVPARTLSRPPYRARLPEGSAAALSLSSSVAAAPAARAAGQASCAAIRKAPSQ